MKVIKIWFLGGLTLQAIIWAHMIILGAVDFLAILLIFISIYALIITGLQLPVLAGFYYLLKDKVESWSWWHSFLIWLSSFLLILFLAYFIG